VSRAVLRPFLIVNVGTRTKPSNDLSLIVKERDVVMPHQAVFAIRPAHPRFMHEGIAGSYCRAPLG